MPSSHRIRGRSGSPPSSSHLPSPSYTVDNPPPPLSRFRRPRRQGVHRYNWFISFAYGPTPSLNESMVEDAGIAEEAELHLLAPSRLIDGLPLHTTILVPLEVPLPSLSPPLRHFPLDAVLSRFVRRPVSDSPVGPIKWYTRLGQFPIWVQNVTNVTYHHQLSHLY
ncbi:hypothetical protein C8F01DRAFT_1085341 [Mycena amicta]|nr:hypothetical protein C8F01DRAFT_1085341 [Mycena amicta]